MMQDVVIACGGVNGLSIALHLKPLGVARVTVLERHHIGAGQSRRAAGILRALVNNSSVASMLLDSLPFFDTFEERFGQPIPFQRPFMAEGFVHRTYACVNDSTPDGMPVLDQAEAAPGPYFAFGFRGGGFSLAPWVGAAVARYVCEGVKPPGMHLLRLSRFREGKLLSWSNAPVSRASTTSMREN